MGGNSVRIGQCTLTIALDRLPRRPGTGSIHGPLVAVSHYRQDGAATGAKVNGTTAASSGRGLPEIPCLLLRSGRNGL